MTTVTNPVLPIPEDTIQGTGSYTVPANKYGFLSANTSFAAAGWIGGNDNHYEIPFVNHGTQNLTNVFNTTATASANNSQAWVQAGDVVATDSLTNAAFGNNIFNASFGNFTEGYQSVTLNGVDFCVSRAAGAYIKSDGIFNHHGIRANGRSGWSIALYPIPKNNLPLNLIEGN